MDKLNHSRMWAYADDALSHLGTQLQSLSPADMTNPDYAAFAAEELTDLALIGRHHSWISAEQADEIDAAAAACQTCWDVIEALVALTGAGDAVWTWDAYAEVPRRPAAEQQPTTAEQQPTDEATMYAAYMAAAQAMADSITAGLSDMELRALGNANGLRAAQMRKGGEALRAIVRDRWLERETRGAAYAGVSTLRRMMECLGR